MLFGRGRELAELTSRVASLRAGQGGACLVAGEPGIGKTSLCDEVAACASKSGVRVAWGRCWERGGAPAYWPWLEVLDALGARFPDGIASTEASNEARFALYRTVTGLLVRASEDVPLLVVLEDLHGADESTLRMTEFVAAHARGRPLLLLGTYRDPEARITAPTAALLTRISRHAPVVTLGRLERDDVAALVRARIASADDRMIDALFAMSQGNPLFAGETAALLRTSGEIALPLSVRETIRQRVGLVSESTRRVLDVASVFGVDVDRAYLACVADDVDDALDEAERAGILTGERTRRRFAHGLYQEVIYRDLPRSRSEELHRVAASVLADSGAPWAARAHHLLEAGASSAADAVFAVVRAAQEALGVFAFEDARVIVERARVAVGRLSEPRLSCMVLCALGEVLVRAGDPKGRETCLAAAELARSLDDAELLAQAGLAYGAAFLTAAVDAPLVRLLEDALERLPPGNTGVRARVTARLAAARQPAIDYRGAVALAKDAIEMARQVSDPGVLVDVLHTAGAAIYDYAPPNERLPLSRELEALAIARGDMAKALRARLRMLMDTFELGDLDTLDARIAEYETLVERLHRDDLRWWAPLLRSTAAMLRGRFDECLERQAQAALEAPLGGREAERALGLHRVAFLRAAERHSELGRVLPSLADLWAGTERSDHVASAHAAGISARIGDETATRTLLDQLPDDALTHGMAIGYVAEAIWLVGDAKKAELVAPMLAEFSERWASYFLVGAVLEPPIARLCALVHGVTGRWDLAERFRADAEARLDRSGVAAALARFHFEYGDLVLRMGPRGEHDRARELVARGRSLAEQLALPELVALVDRRHGVRSAPPPPRRTTTHVSLTCEGECWRLESSAGTSRLKDSRGLAYLARLLERPFVEIHAIDLATSGKGLADRGDAGPLVDEAARTDYRRRLEDLREALHEAEAFSDVHRASTLRAEMDALVGELARATGLGGRERKGPTATDRARIAVRRRIKDALDRIAICDPVAGAWLRRTVRTGNYCSYQPDE